MVEMHSPIGTSLSTSVQSKRTGNLTIDGEHDAVTHTDADPPSLRSAQCPAAEPQPQCAAAAMMHGVSRPPASSWQGGCPTIAEHQEFMPPMQPPMQTSMQPYVILPNPGYKIEANLWNLDVQRSARIPGPLASFLRHCNTMDSPYTPSYGKGGPQPADDITNLARHASMENLRELQKYSEKPQFEVLVVLYGPKAFKTRSWMSKSESNRGSRAWLMSLSGWNVFNQHGSINCRIKVVHPHLRHPWWHLPVSSSQHHPAQLLLSRSSQPLCQGIPSMASAPQNAPFPASMGADPWAEAKMKQQLQW